jgi:hypothetical protein
MPLAKFGEGLARLLIPKELDLDQTEFRIINPKSRPQ